MWIVCLKNRSKLGHIVEVDASDVICLTEILPKNSKSSIQISELQIARGLSLMIVLLTLLVNKFTVVLLCV